MKFLPAGLVLGLSICGSALAADLCGSLPTHVPITGSPYQVTCDIVVPPGQSTTIESGVTLVFNLDTALRVEGALSANGVIFTADQVSPFGGWKGIGFAPASGPSTLSGTQVLHAGAQADFFGSLVNTNVYTATSNLTIIGSTLADSVLHGLWVEGDAAPTVTNNVFQNNNCAIRGIGNGSGVITSGNTATGNLADAICVQGSLSGPAVTWGALDLPYALHNVTIDPGATLVIESGITVHALSNASKLQVEGALEVTGARFPGRFPGAAANDWLGIEFSANALPSILNQVEITGGVSTHSSNLTLQNSLVGNSQGYGLEIADDAVPVVINNRFESNGACAILARSLDSTAVATVGNTTADNWIDGFCFYGILTAPGLHWSATDMPYVLEGDAVVSAGTTLTIDPGVTVWGAGDLLVEGALNAQSVLFTSWKSQPIPGDWGGISFSASSGPSVLDNVDVAYGGAFTNYFGVSTSANIVIEGAGVTIRNSTIRDSSSDGIELVGGGTPTVESTTFEGNAECAILASNVDDTGVVTLNNNATSNGMNGICAQRWQNVPQQVWSSSDLPYVLLGDVEIPTGSALTIEPGVVVLGTDWAQLTIEGSLEARNVRFSSAFPVPQPGDWSGVGFASTATGSVLEDVTIANAGALGFFSTSVYASIFVASNDVTINRVSVSDSGGAGIVVHGAAPALTDLRILRSETGISYQQSAGGTVRNSTLARNAVGVQVDFTSLPDLGGAAGSSQGQNNFVCNTVSVDNANASTVYAEGNWWGASPPLADSIGAVDRDPSLTNESRPVIIDLAVRKVINGVSSKDLELDWSDVAPCRGYRVYSSILPSSQSFGSISGYLATPGFTDVGGWEDFTQAHFYLVHTD